MKDKKVIFVKGDKSKWFEQAIFIVKEDIPKSQLPVNFLFEAEKIVNNFFKKRSVADFQKSVQNEAPPLYTQQKHTENTIPKKKKPESKRKKTSTDFFLNSGLIICFILLSVLLFLASK